MKFISVLAAILISGFGSCSVKAQISVVPVNGGTGNLVSIPIPGGSGLNVTVGTGSAALPLQNIANTDGAQHLYLGDDSSANVPLQFSFPFFGQNFTNSWMYSNGIVSFNSGNIPGAGCCGGINLANLAGQGTRNSVYNYMIAPLWTDLIDTTGQATWYKGTNNSMTYGWYNTAEYGTNNRSSFEVNINSSGAMDVRYGSSFVSMNHTVTAGMTGDLSQGQYFQYYNGQGFNVPTTGLSWGALQGTPGVNICYTNPLSDPSCPGYYEAYRTQQCTISALYDPSCPGYQQAYFDQQCSINPLYSSNCPGYSTAYHDQQCSINPLYATDCTGYQTAYHDRQCSLNVLSYTDCPGYAAAYLDQQCSANPLYSTTCSGYAQAYFSQQCTANPLYNAQCPGYAQAYFSQQCSLNGLYDRSCSNYGTAYATQQALLQSQQQSTTTNSTSTTSTNSTTASTTQPSVAVSSNGTVSTSVPIVSDTNVNTVITSTSTSTTSSTPSAPVQLTSPTPSQSSSPAAPMAPIAVAQAQQKTEDKKAEDKKNDTPSNSSTTTSSSGNSSSDDKSSNQPKTARQELQERRESAAKAKAVEAGKNLGDTMSKAASMEQQTAIQNVVIAAMGYSPAFEAYKVMMPDVVGYKPYSIYKNQTTVDNRRLGYGLFGATDKLHLDMVDSQYNKGN